MTNITTGTGRSRRRAAAVLACLGLGAVVVLPSGAAAQTVQTWQAASTCAEPKPGGEPQALKPTTISTIEQAYSCILTNYYGADTLDNRQLLIGAFAGLTRELHASGHDVADATLPALTGKRDSDWEAFSAVYTRVNDQLSGATERQAAAAATLLGMLGSLHNNHAHWDRTQMPEDPQPGTEYGIGLDTAPFKGPIFSEPDQVTGPMYVSRVRGGSAAKAGLRPGDIIESVNGAVPFAGGVLSLGAVVPLFQNYPDDDPVRIKVRRPANGRTWTATLTPGVYKPDEKATARVTSKLLKGDVAYVRLASFGQRVAQTAIDAINDMKKNKKLTGVVLDMRGNSGGLIGEVNRLLGAFAHDQVTAWQCDADDRCTADRTDDSVPLLGLPLTVLADRDCASACDHFVAAIKDNKIAPVVGTRTAGVVAGAGKMYLLDDNSLLSFPDKRTLGPKKEPINGIGVAADHLVPLTAKDISTGKDPGLDKALDLLK